MKIFTKIIAATVTAVIVLAIVVGLTGCEVEASTDGSYEDTKNTQVAADRLQTNQPTPTDIEYSLER